MTVCWPEPAASFLFVDCRNTLFAFLPDPLDWRALQCACRWRTGLEDLLAKVHLDPRLRSAVGRCICTLRRLPREDLLGDRVQSAELSVESERFFVTLLGARPKGVQGKALDLSFWHSQLTPKQGRSLGLWLQSSKLKHLSLANCDGLLQDYGLSNVLCSLGSAKLQLRQLNLCAAELSPASSSALVDIMTRCPLQTLNLAFNVRLMTPAGLEGLVRAAVNTEFFALQRLVLKHCDIAAKAAAKLACWLSHMPDLKELILDWNVAMYTSLGLRGLVQGMSCMGTAGRASGAFSALRTLQLGGCQLGSGAEAALRDFLRQCPALRQLEVPECLTSQRIWAELGRCGRKDHQSCGKKPAFLQAMRQSAVRECLRCLLPGPLDWRAMQIACRWGDGTSNGPLSEVHRRPRLRSTAVKMARRLRGIGDLLGAAALKLSAEELRFAVEILGARPRQAPRVRLPEIQALDLSHEHLLTGGQMLAPLQGRALGIFLRHCPQLQELCLLGHAQICTAAGLEGLMKGLGELRLPLRSLHFGGCGVTEHAAPHLGRFLRQCPELASLSLAGSWQLCTAAGLRVVAEIWEVEGSCGYLHLEELNLTNCRLGTSSAEALGVLLRKCCFLTKLVLSGNQDLFDAAAIVYLLKGLGDSGFPRLREITTGSLLEEEAFEKASLLDSDVPHLQTKQIAADLQRAFMSWRRWKRQVWCSQEALLLLQLCRRQAGKRIGSSSAGAMLALQPNTDQKALPMTTLPVVMSPSDNVSSTVLCSTRRYAFQSAFLGSEDASASRFYQCFRGNPVETELRSSDADAFLCSTVLSSNCSLVSMTWQSSRLLLLQHVSSRELLPSVALTAVYVLCCAGPPCSQRRRPLPQSAAACVHMCLHLVGLVFAVRLSTRLWYASRVRQLDVANDQLRDSDIHCKRSDARRSKASPPGS
ncbi:unnamed protein product [Symbiodinium sp. CCMP2592]|nr:unnamed protein product [Symbiodinium sp. CCMP2592]